jgi:hypothetical protein
MKALCSGGLLCWLSLAAAAPPEAMSPGRFERRQDIRIDSRAEGIHRFELPESVYTGSRRADLGDIRIFNGSGQVVPHALIDYEAPASADVKTASSPFFPLRTRVGRSDGSVDVSVHRTSGGALVSAQLRSGSTEKSRLAGYIVDASAVAATRRAIVLEWKPQPDGTVLPVKVSASNDLQAWQEIAPGTQLVDLPSAGQRLLQKRIDLNGDPNKYFRILWPESQEGIVVSSAAIETGSAASRPSRLQWTAAAALQAGKAEGEFLFETAGLPVEAIRLRLPERNTVVPLRILHRGSEREPWQEAASTVVYRVERGGEALLSSPVRVCCSAHRFWRISFDQRGGGIGQGQPEVELGWAPQQGLFVARGNGPFVLAYGDARTGPSGFSAATLVPGYRSDQYPGFPQARFDAPTKRVAAPTLEPEVKPTNWRSIGLWGVLCAGVLLLAAMVWRLQGELSKSTDD